MKARALWNCQVKAKCSSFLLLSVFWPLRRMLPWYLVALIERSVCRFYCYYRAGARFNRYGRWQFFRCAYRSLDKETANREQVFRRMGEHHPADDPAARREDHVCRPFLWTRAVSRRDSVDAIAHPRPCSENTSASRCYTIAFQR